MQHHKACKFYRQNNLDHHIKYLFFSKTINIFIINVQVRFNLSGTTVTVKKKAKSAACVTAATRRNGKPN